MLNIILEIITILAVLGKGAIIIIFIAATFSALKDDKKEEDVYIDDNSVLRLKSKYGIRQILENLGFEKSRYDKDVYEYNKGLVEVNIDLSTKVVKFRSDTEYQYEGFGIIYKLIKMELIELYNGYYNKNKWIKNNVICFNGENVNVNGKNYKFDDNMKGKVIIIQDGEITVDGKKLKNGKWE